MKRGINAKTLEHYRILIKASTRTSVISSWLTRAPICCRVVGDGFGGMPKKEWSIGCSLLF